MLKMNTVLLSLLLLLSACSSIKEPNSSNENTKKAAVSPQIKLSQLTRWQLQGKIAFISKDERNSADISWYKDSIIGSQQLNLTSYLGINVLSLRSVNQTHTIEFDGKTYKSEELDQFVYQLTGYFLPAKALAQWIKGQTYHDNEHMIFDEKTQLAKTLTSEYQGRKWEVKYNNFQTISGYPLPSKLTIKQADLTIKIAITEWTI